MLTKFALALLLGASAVEAQYRPYRRAGPTGPSGPTRRGGPSGPTRRGGPHAPEPEENFELDIDFEASGNDHLHTAYTAASNGGAGIIDYGSTHEEPAEDENAEPAPVVPDGWFSATEEYSPAYIDYESAMTKKYQYAMCNMMATSNDDDASGTVRLVQFKGQATKAKMVLEGLEASTAYKLRINLFGAMGEECADVGPEFNPLRELNAYGDANPFQDPSRGRFTDLESDADGKIDGYQEKLEQNLAGYESLLGLSLSLVTGEGADEKVSACCVIGRDAAPTKPKPKPVQHSYPNSAYHPSRGHYGSYGTNNNSHGGYGGSYGGSQYGGYGGGYGGYGGYGGNSGNYGGSSYGGNGNSYGGYGGGYGGYGGGRRY